MFKIKKEKENYTPRKPGLHSTNEEVLDYFHKNYMDGVLYNHIDEDGGKYSLEPAKTPNVERKYMDTYYNDETGNIRSIEAGFGYVYGNGVWAEIVK